MSIIVNPDGRKHKHLTLDDRITIEQMLKSGANFKEIATVLGKDPSTVSRKVRHNLISVTSSFTQYDEQGWILNEKCHKIFGPPYVCNGCSRFRYCRRQRFVYTASRLRNVTKKFSGNPGKESL